MSLTVDSTGNPIKVTGTTAADAQVIATTSLIHVKFMYWYNITTSGHLLVVTDGQGREIAVSKCQKDGDYEIIPIMSGHYGIRISDMDSGTLYIYHK